MRGILNTHIIVTALIINSYSICSEQRKWSPNPISRPAQPAKQTPDSLHMYLRKNWVDTVTAEKAHQILVVIMDHFQLLECEVFISNHYHASS